MQIIERIRLRGAAAALLLTTFGLTIGPVVAAEAPAESTAPAWLKAAVPRLVSELVVTHGEAARPRAERGVAQVAQFWRAEDGDEAILEAFVERHFAGDPAALDEMFTRFETLSEQIGGHMLEIVLALRRQSDLDLGPIRPYDEIFASYNPSAHLLDDFFANKLAFVVLLNFPLTTLEERLGEGAGWSRRQWAEARLAASAGKRIPAAASQAVSRAAATADQYISQYNIWMHHLLDDSDERLFPPKQRLISHWNLRDEIKAQYPNGEEGLPRQRMIQKVMERIVTQTIPAVVVDNPHVDWNPFSNEVAAAAVSDTDEAPPADLAISNEREPDTRYAMLLGTFQGSRQIDPYSPTAPTLIARRFDENREIPEARVRAIFDELLTSPLLGRVAALIEQRLGRPLEPFDLWYPGFRPRPTRSDAELDALVRERYPTPEAYERDIPSLLVQLGFAPERAATLAANIVVEPARGAGHAWGAAMRSAPTRLRTRVGKEGMDYKGFNIAVHEMGHNVEQTISLNDIDHTLLAGVPNTAFTEALAFVFQAQDLRLLGVESEDPMNDALRVLDDFWGAAEIASVALVDMGVWHWMYEHPGATPAELREATVAIARDVWNRYWADHLGGPDSVLLGIYSHMIDSFLYLPDYPLGHLIAFQIEEQMRKAAAQGRSLGEEFERMAKTGNVAPDLWMVKATAAPVGPEALLAAAERALGEVGAGPNG